MNIIKHVTAATLFAVVASSAFAQKKYDTGASDTAVRIGQTIPLSGPVSAWGALGKVSEAYFRMINEKGGINGRKIEVITYDDAYEPAKTVEMTRKAVEADNVLFMAGSMGTGPQLAVAKYLNQKKIPQLFVASAAGKLADPKTYPYTMMAAPSYEAEGATWLKHITATKPTAKVAVIYQDDDAGRAIFNGFKQNLNQTGVKMVSAQTYSVTDPSIDSQLIAMKSSGADTVLLITVPKMTAMSLRKIRSLNWEPTMYLSQGGAAIKSALEPAGLENAKGVITVSIRMNLGDPDFADHPDMKEYLAFAAKYMPGTNATTDDIYLSGYVNAALTAYVIQQAGDNLTRENIKKVATNLKNVRLPTLLPGITLNSTPTDYHLYKQLQLRQFDGKNYVPLGKIINID